MGAGKSGGVKSGNQSLTGLDRALEQRCLSIQKVHNVLLICLDDNEDGKSAAWQQAIVDLQCVVSNIITLPPSDQCMELLKVVNDNKICLVMSGSLGQQFAPRVHDMPQIDSILIFSEDKTQDEQWTKNLSKVKGVFTEAPPMCDALKQAAQHCEQDALPLSFVLTTKNLDQIDIAFIYAQVVKEIISASNFEESQLKDFMSYCREILADNPVEMAHIQVLESRYRSETPIWWYTGDTFLASMLTRALRTMNGEVVPRMGFFIADLHRQIEKLHQEQYPSSTPASAAFTVYYAQGIARSELDQMKKCQRGFISFNNVVLANKNSTSALTFAQDTAAKGELIGVMFVMKIDPTQSSTPYACIRGASYSQAEDEVLFSMHAVFRINEIKRLTANNRLQEVHVGLLGDKDKELALLTKNVRQETFSDQQGWFRLGSMLMKMRQFDRAEQVYRSLLNQVSDDSEKAPIYDQLGWIKDDQEKYSEAVEFYEKSLAIYQKNPSVKPLELANVYYYIGTAYHKMENYPKALAAHTEGLKIREQSLPGDHPDLAKAYSNVGLVYASMNDYPTALSYLEKDLAVSQKALPANHPDLAMSYMNVGMVSYNLDDYPKALSAYEKVLAIQQKTLPANHADLAKINNYIGLVHNSLGNHPKALTYHEKALAIREKTLPKNHPDIGTTYNNIGVTYENMGNHVKARTFLERAVEAGEQSLAPDNPTLKMRRDNLQRVKEKV